MYVLQSYKMLKLLKGNPYSKERSGKADYARTYNKPILVHVSFQKFLQVFFPKISIQLQEYNPFKIPATLNSFNR